MKTFIKDMGIAAVIVLVTLQFFEPTRVVGVSMQPNFRDKDYLILSKEAYSKKEPQRGDIVVFKSSLKDEKGDDEMLIKRVVGLPGERVEIRNGKVYIDGDMIDEDYTKDAKTDGTVSVVVPEGKYFCMGDNRGNSTDSRAEAVGPVDKEFIKGKVVFRVFPFSKFGKIGSSEA